MKHGISTISVVPVRSEPSETSEMVTQILFGETFSIVKDKENKKWFYIKLDFDGYEGWIDSKTITLLTDKSYLKIIDNPKKITTEPITEINPHNDSSQLIPAGSVLPNYNGKKSFKIHHTHYTITGNVKTNETNNIRNFITETAKLLVHTPYLWGGRSSFGIDCSGFSQLVYKMAGIKIPRDATKQSKHGKVVNFINEASPADIVFFDNTEGIIIHCGIYLGNSEIIHASGKVRIDLIDHEGIYNRTTRRYTHHLRVVKDFIGK